MIDLYYWTTPNGHKITLFLEETGLPYAIHPINISQGDQFQADFLKVSPNNKIPAIVDRQPADGGAPLSLFESGAILLYLAEKTGRFLAKDLRARQETLQWLFWQMGGLGPMAGQNHHFNRFAPEDSLRYRPLRQGNRAPVRRSRPAPGGPRLRRRRRLQHRRHGHLSVDRPAPVAGAGSRRLPTPAALVRAFASVRRRNAPMLWWSASIRRSSGSRAGLRTSSRTIAGGACAALRSSLT